MSTIVIDISPEAYKRLEEQARHAGKAPEALTRELLEKALRDPKGPAHRTARDVLESLDRIRPLGETLRRKIIPGVTLDEVRTSLSQAEGPSLSEIVLHHRDSFRQ
jgi:predicted DNA-binding protein